MNTKESFDFPLRHIGCMGTGNATIAGNAQTGVNIDVAMTTNRNTNFTYMKEGVASAVSNQFHTLRRQDTAPRILGFHHADVRIRAGAERSHGKAKVTPTYDWIPIDATPDATMKIIMDPLQVDYISGKGTGISAPNSTIKEMWKCSAVTASAREFINSALPGSYPQGLHHQRRKYHHL